jgi:hypothetical protein
MEIVHVLTESVKRVVKVRTAEAEWGSATRFWLQEYRAPNAPENSGLVPRAHYA